MSWFGKDENQKQDAQVDAIHVIKLHYDHGESLYFYAPYSTYCEIKKWLLDPEAAPFLEIFDCTENETSLARKAGIYGVNIGSTLK